MRLTGLLARNKTGYGKHAATGGLGYMSYPGPAGNQVGYAGYASPVRSLPLYPGGPGSSTEPTVGSMYPLTLGWPQSGMYSGPHKIVPVNNQPVAQPTGHLPRWMTPGFGVARPGVAAQTPQVRQAFAHQQGVAAPQTFPLVAPATGQYAKRSPYSYYHPAQRIGPIPKLSSGSGLTGTGNRDNRALGFAPAGYATQQYMPVTQFDYMPPLDESFDIGISEKTPYAGLPKSIAVGTDGREMVGTYQPHDFTPAAHFFKQGRSGGNWQDMSFGPDYRQLLDQQQVARYNLYNQVALARPLSPNAYFLGYQTQASVSQMIGGTAQGRPLGY